MRVELGTGMPVAELERVWRRLQPLAVDKMPLSVPPPRGSRFGSPLVLIAGPLGAPGDGRRSQLRRVDAGRFAPACGLSGRARGQAGYRGTA